MVIESIDTKPERMTFYDDRLFAWRIRWNDKHGVHFYSPELEEVRSAPAWIIRKYIDSSENNEEGEHK